MNSSAQVFLSEKNWDSFYKCLSATEAKILGIIRNRKMTAGHVARSLLRPEKINSVSSICSRLVRSKVLKMKGKEYFVADQDLAKFLALQDFSPSLTLESAMNEIERTVYRETIGIFEVLEHSGKTFGNGHHAAQKLAAFAKQMVEERWVKT